MKKRIYVARVSQIILLLGVSTVVMFSQTDPGHPLDINDLPFKVEMRRLDAVAKELKSDSNKIVYLIGFNKTGRSKQTALNRIEKSKNYLVVKHHILRSRVKTLYGGRQNGLVMRITVVQKSDALPSKP
jgi:hypothetical protein